MGTIYYLLYSVKDTIGSKSIKQNEGGSISKGTLNSVQSSKKISKTNKGQLISKCPLSVTVSTKIPTKKFDNFCPRI